MRHYCYYVIHNSARSKKVYRYDHAKALMDKGYQLELWIWIDAINDYSFAGMMN